MATNKLSSSASTSFQVPKMPSLKEAIDMYGLTEGVVRFDQQMEQWRQALQRNIGERFQAKN